MLRNICLGLGLLLCQSTFAYAAGLQVRLVSITSPIPPCSKVILLIATESGATCTGQRQAHRYNEVQLQSVEVGPNGRAKWEWQVLCGNRPGGVRTVHVTCTKGDRRSSVWTSFDVR
jgi:hypothetical protein